MNQPKASTSTSETATNTSTGVRAFCRAWVLRPNALEVGLDGRIGKRAGRRKDYVQTDEDRSSAPQTRK